MRLLTEQINVSVGDILDMADNQLFGLAEALLLKKAVSFQDMQSISRAFKDFVGVEVKRSPEVNDIIVAQACRHAIVHNGARVDDRLLKQIRNAAPRHLHPPLLLGGAIAFSDTDVRTVGSSMFLHLHALARDARL